MWRSYLLTATDCSQIVKFQKPQVEPLTSSIEHHIRAQPTGCVSIFWIVNGEIDAHYHCRGGSTIRVLLKLVLIARDVQKEPEDGLTSAERAFL